MITTGSGIENPSGISWRRRLSWRHGVILVFFIITLLFLVWGSGAFGDPRNLNIFLLERQFISPPTSTLSPQPASLRSGYSRCNASSYSSDGSAPLERVAICVSGLTRSFASAEVQESLAKHFMRDRYDIYLSLSDQFDSRSLRVPITCQWTGSLPVSESFRPVGCPHNSFNHRRNLRMAYRWLACMRMIEKQEQRNPSLVYSHVMFIRSDVMYTRRAPDVGLLYERHRAGSLVVSWDDQAALTTRVHAGALGLGAVLAYSSCANAQQWARACQVTHAFAQWNVETRRVPCCPLRLVAAFENVTFRDCGFLYNLSGAQCLANGPPSPIHLFPRHMAQWWDPIGGAGDSLMDGM